MPRLSNLIRRQTIILGEVDEIIHKIKDNAIGKVEAQSYIDKLLVKESDAEITNLAIGDWFAKNHKNNLPLDKFYYKDGIYGSIWNFIKIAIGLLENIQKNGNIADIKETLESQLQRNQQLQQQIQKLQLKIEQESETMRIKEESHDLICQFRRKVNKLRFSLLQQKVEPPTVNILESNKKRWQKQLDAIKGLYMKMGPETEINKDIREEYELIEREFNFVHQATTKEISCLKNPNHSEGIDAIQIPQFNGDASEWTTFYYLFKKFVHENAMLPKVEKMVRLKSLLHGEPLELIDYLSVAEHNYDRAWSIIVQKYRNKIVLFTNLVDKVLDHRNICSKSVEDIKSLLQTTNECMETLRLSAINTEDIEPIITRIIIKKFDEEGLLRFECTINQKSKGMQLLDDVYKFLEVEHRVLQATQTTKSTYLRNLVPKGDIDKETHHNILHSDEVTAAPWIAEVGLTTACFQTTSITPQLCKKRTNMESQTLNNLSLGAEKSKINLEKCLPANITPPGSSNQEIAKELYDATGIKHLLTQKLFPPAPRPADKLVSVIDLDILAGKLNVYWRSDEFDEYHTLRDSGLYDRAWEMLDRVAEDVITRKLSDRRLLGINKESSAVTQLKEIITESPLVQLSRSKRQDLFTKFRRTITLLVSIAAELTEGQDPHTTEESTSASDSD